MTFTLIFCLLFYIIIHLILSTNLILLNSKTSQKQQFLVFKIINYITILIGLIILYLKLDFTDFVFISLAVLVFNNIIYKYIYKLNISFLTNTESKIFDFIIYLFILGSFAFKFLIIK
jgi:hypothetical protein